jgi:hypothetical protein
LSIPLIPSFKIGTLKLINIPNYNSVNIAGWVKRNGHNKTTMMGSLRLTHPTFDLLCDLCGFAVNNYSFFAKIG